jgi:hypothetical protein
VTLIAAGERDLANLLAEHSSNRLPSHTAETAINRAKRRRMGVVLSGVFAILLAATVWVAWIRVEGLLGRATAEMTTNHKLTETLDLKCLSPEQAGELISPYVRSNGSLYYLPKSALRVITVRATAQEMGAVKVILGRFDTAPAGSCAITPPGAPR